MAKGRIKDLEAQRAAIELGQAVARLAKALHTLKATPQLVPSSAWWGGTTAAAEVGAVISTEICDVLSARLPATELVLVAGQEGPNLVN